MKVTDKVLQNKSRVARTIPNAKARKLKDGARIMKQFSIIHIPVLSFYSKALYRDVGLYWKGVGFAYLLLLLAICWVPTMIEMHTGFSHFVDNDAPPVVEQVPKIMIVDGQVSIAEPQPYYIKAPENDEILAIIDTTGSIDSLENTDALCLVTKTKLIIRKNEFQTQTFELTEVKDFVLDSERIMDWLHTAKKFLVIIMYPFALLVSYLYRIVQALIYAAIGLLFASSCKVRLFYATLLRLAIVAVTPCVLVNTVLGIAGVHLPYAGLIYLLVTLGYLFFGVKATSEAILLEEETDVPEETGI